MKIITNAICANKSLRLNEKLADDTLLTERIILPCSTLRGRYQFQL